MTFLQQMLFRLTDAYQKDPNSNIGKLLSIAAEHLERMRDTQQRMSGWRDIDQAEGATLDRIGTNVVQARGVATDEVYRILIKSKIARNLSKGDVNTIIAVLSTALDADPTEVKIRETFEDPDFPEPAGISLISLPLARLNAVGMDPYQFARIIQKTVAAGVRVGAIELTGTFEYGEVGDPLDNGKGFATIAGTTGGTIGAVYSPGTGEDLPI